MKQNILDILKQKGSGFKVPKGYFETVETAVMSEMIAEKFPKHSGFSAPKGYFDTVEESVSSKLHVENFPIREGFTTPKKYFDTVEDEVFAKLDKKTQNVSKTDIPKDYFDTLEDRIFTRLKEEDTVKEPKVISLGERFKKVAVPLAVAASLVLIFMIGYRTSSETTLNDVANAEIDQWIEEDLINLDSYEIAEVFDDINLASSDTNEDDELLDYLNGTDVENILLEN